MTEHWIDEVLAFWFAELTEEDWFMANAETDRAIRERFEPLNLELRRAVPAICRSEARAALAAIIALDQFPRNIWRGKAEAFATDDQAVDPARNAVERGRDLRARLAGLGGEGEVRNKRQNDDGDECAHGRKARRDREQAPAFRRNRAFPP